MSVSPAITGTHRLGLTDALYTAGADHVADACRDVLRNTSRLAVDIEGYGLGLNARRLKCVTVASTAHAIVLDPRVEQQAELLVWMMSHASELIFHNSAFDIPNLYRNGLFQLAHLHKVTDTILYARLAWPDLLTKKSLEAVSERLLGIDRGETIDRAFRRLGLSKVEGYRQIDIDSPLFLLGAATDGVATAHIRTPVREAAYRTLTTDHPFAARGVSGDEAWRLVDREQVINRSALRRACIGIRCDLEYLDQYRSQTQAQLWEDERQLTDAGITPGNGNTLMTVLDKLHAVPDGHPRTPKTGRLSTAEKHLDRLGHPLARLFTRAKKVAKVDKDYLSKAIELRIDGRIFPETNLLKATTGRMSISGVPLQQFPGPARGVVLADKGQELASIDWSQIEPVTAANLAGDEAMLAGYEDGSSDVYTALAGLAGITRTHAKTVLLAQMYGEGLYKLSTDLGITVERAAELKSSIFRAAPLLERYIYKLRDIARRHRQMITLSGRIIPIPMGRGFDGGPPSVASHLGVNYHIQGSAYDLLAETWVSIIEEGLGDAVYFAMHDELVTDSEAAGDIEQIMQRPPERLVWLSGRQPIIRTDMVVLGERWAKPE